MKAAQVFRKASGVENGTHIIGKLHKSGDERIIPADLAICIGCSSFRPRRSAYSFKATKFRTEKKKIDAACKRTKIGVMQNHTPIGVGVWRSGISDREIGCIARELRWRRGSKERFDGRRGGIGYIGVRISDAATPGIALACHQNEGIEDRAQAASFQILKTAH